MTGMAERIAAKLEAALSPERLNVIDESHQHQGHGGWREGGETHFRVDIVSQTFAGLTWNAATIGAFVVAFLGSVGMWLVYFNIGAERSSRVAAASDDPGRIGRSGYTYLHILIVAGIIVAAVGDAARRS